MVLTSPFVATGATATNRGIDGGVVTPKRRFSRTSLSRFAAVATPSFRRVATAPSGFRSVAMEVDYSNGRYRHCGAGSDKCTYADECHPSFGAALETIHCPQLSSLQTLSELLAIMLILMLCGLRLVLKGILDQ